MSKKTKMAVVLMLVILFLLLALGLGVIYYYLNQNDSTVNATTTTNTNEQKEIVIEEDPVQFNPDEYVKQFDGKQYKLSDLGNNVEGYATIVVDENETSYGKVKVGYFLKITDNFSKTSYLDLGSDYNLLGNLQTADQARQGDGTGVVGAVLCDKDQWPDLKEMIVGDSYEQTKMYFDCTWDDMSMLGAETNVFYHHFINYYQAKDFKLDHVTELTKLEIYDSSKYYQKDSLEDGTEYYDYDEETVVKEGEILATYNIEYKEVN